MASPEPLEGIAKIPSPVVEEQRGRDVALAFRERFGREPEGVWAAPGRANLIGEHTDYNDGFVLPFALSHAAVAAAAPRTDRKLRLASAQSGEALIELDGLRPGSLSGWPAYVGGAVWSLIQTHGVAVTGLDLLLDSDVPSGAGLSSSAAVECVTSLATSELFGATLTPLQLALSAQRAEVEMAGVPCGMMDQVASMCGADERALFLDCRTLEIRLVPFRLGDAGLAALIVDTRAPHRLVSGEYAARRRDCETAAKVLGVPALRDATLAEIDASSALDERCRRRARHVVSENRRVLEAVAALERGDVAAVGPLVTASHASLRDDFEVTVPELDVTVDTALEAGALGARMMGGGFGGSVIVLLQLGRVADVFEAIRRTFAAKGFAPPRSFIARASQGARRLQLV
jgi:galactokinase